MNDPLVPPAINEAISQVCELPHHEHVLIILAAQIIVQFTMALINYFGFTKNPNVKSSTLFEATINILKSMMALIFKRRSP